MVSLTFPRSHLNSSSLIPKKLKFWVPKPECEYYHLHNHHLCVPMHLLSICHEAEGFETFRWMNCFRTLCYSFFSETNSSHIQMTLKSLLGSEENWESLDDMKRINMLRKTPMSGRSFFFFFLGHEIYCSAAHD